MIKYKLNWNKYILLNLKKIQKNIFNIIKSEKENSKSQMNKPINVLGIYLGTKYSCVGTYKNGKIEIIPNDSGERTISSVIFFENNQILVGKSAKNLLIENPKNTKNDSKRLIGRRFNDKIVRRNKIFGF